MREVNAAYRVLSDPRQRAAYDARRYLRPVETVSVATRPRPRPVVHAPSEAPTELQRRVDRIVAVVGVCLLIAIGAYAVLVIPRAEQQFQNELRGIRPTAAPVPTLLSHSNAAATVPERLRSDAGLRNFPGTVLVPPSDLAPFKDLPILRLDATGQGIARYAVYYGDLTTGSASVSGLIGRASFDAAAPRLPDCAPDAAYCAGPGVGQSSSDAPGVELFRPPDLVNDDPAFETHRVCCNGVFWSLGWYEPNTNMSYTIDLSRNVAMQFGGSTADGDLPAARAVAALARQLVQLK
jgi:hypothetical protein